MQPGSLLGLVLGATGDRGFCLARLCQQAQPEVLGDVCILILIDENVFEPVLEVAQHIFVFPEQADAFSQQIAEVTGVEDFQTFLIGGIEFASTAIAKGPGVAFRYLIRAQRLVFPTIDQSGQLARRPTFVVNAFCLNQLLEQSDLVIGVENCEARLQADQFSMATQDLHADGVKCA